MVVVSEAAFDDYLAHYGIKRRSGRYPWGSGGNSDYAVSKDLLNAIKSLRSSPNNMSETEIAKALGFESTTEYRANIAIAGIIKKQGDIATAERLKNTGMSNKAIGEEMGGLNESSVRGLLAPQAARKANQIESVANVLRQRVGEDSYIDVGKGTEHHLGITKTKLDLAIAVLEQEGFVTASILQPSATTSHDTRVRVLAKPGETWSSINQNKANIRPAKVFANSEGKPEIWKEPLHLDPNRLQIKYAKDGGADADGVIYIRPGVPDLTLRGASYAQVRIQVGKGHYIKGMAVMKKGLPDGVDVQFNTNKSDTGNKLDALKPVKPNSEPLERFGAVFRQITNPKTGKVESHLNIVNDDDNWDDWSRSLASQMLSKQSPDLVKRQLDVTYANKKARLDEIMQLTNPVVRKELLKAYADDMDSSSVHLKAAALPRQKTHVILPVNSLKDNEVYAPGYKDGERVVLVRYPHGGKFEIPELVVNNRNRAAREIMPPDKSRAAIGINSKVASRLSGADFDGDTVVVIPNNSGRIKHESPLQKLKGFDPQESYRGSSGTGKDGKPIMLPGVKRMTNTQTEMGKISNLITDMTIAGANHEELARAVRHSMVVIDAEKHGLDYKRSAQENTIAALRKKYQPGRYGGAATIISRTGREQRVLDFKRQPQGQGTGNRKGPTDKDTGEPIYVPTGKTTSRRVVDKETGEVTWVKEPKTTKVSTGSRLPGTVLRDPYTGEARPIKDAYDLVSGPANVPKAMRGTQVERHYAEYSNRVRDLANAARKAEVNTPDPKINLSAKQTYKSEVTSLKAKLKTAQANSPRERQAQAAAAVIIKMKRDANPQMKPDELKRVKSSALRTTRARMDARPQKIDITAKEWEAIQAGAVASSVLREILTKADTKQVQELAQPKTDRVLPKYREAHAKSLLKAGYTRAEVAEQLGVSVSTLDRALK